MVATVSTHNSVFAQGINHHSLIHIHNTDINDDEDADTRRGIQRLSQKIKQKFKKYRWSCSYSIDPNGLCCYDFSLLSFTLYRSDISLVVSFHVSCLFV